MQSDLKTHFSNNPLFERALIAEQSFPKSALYIVGLPIGNAADITLRALWILSLCDVIACEDTRESRKLLDRYSITTPTIAVHEHNEREAAEKIIEMLRCGNRIALVTDAGTPAISDPGARAVQSVRAAGFQVVPVPGASAAVTAMSGAGLDAYSFTFAGFVPPTAKAREARLKTLIGRGEAFVLYEAPHRVKDLLMTVATLTDVDRRVVVCRELTKRFETFYEMKAGEIAHWLETHEAKGEYAIFIDEKKTASAQLDAEVLKWARAIAEEIPQSRAAAVVAKVTGIKRDVIYNALLEKSSA